MMYHPEAHELDCTPRHAGMVEDTFVDLVGIESNMMETIDIEYFYGGDSLRDPYGTNKDYGLNDMVRMLYDMEEYSGFEQPYDMFNIV
jgi:hypothetical protein